MIKQVDLQVMVVSCLIVNHYRAFKYVRELRPPPPPLAMSSLPKRETEKEMKCIYKFIRCDLLLNGWRVIALPDNTTVL